MNKVDNRDIPPYSRRVARPRGERHPRRRGLRAARVSVVVLVLLQALALYQLVFRAHGRPSFRRGGAFAIVGTTGRPVPYAPAGSDASTTTTASAAGATLAPPDARAPDATQGE